MINRYWKCSVTRTRICASMRFASRSATSTSREALYHYATNGFHEERDPRVRFQWALSLGNKYDLVTGVMLGLILRQDTADRWMRLAVQSSHPDNAGIVLNSLIRDSAKEDVNPQAMREMAALFAAEGGKHFEPDFRGILAEMGKKSEP